MRLRARPSANGSNEIRRSSLSARLRDAERWRPKMSAPLFWIFGGALEMPASLPFPANEWQRTCALQTFVPPRHQS